MWPQSYSQEKTVILPICVLFISYKGIFSNIHVPCRLSFLIFLTISRFPSLFPSPLFSLFLLSSLLILPPFVVVVLFELNLVLWRKQRWLRTNLAWLMASPHTNNCNTRHPTRILLERQKTKFHGDSEEKDFICLWGELTFCTHLFIHSFTTPPPAPPRMPGILPGTEGTV